MIRSVIIAGSRTVSPTVEEIDAAIARLDPAGLLWVPSEWTEIVCGMASGADLAGKAWAEARGKDVWPEPITTEDIRVHGKYLGPKIGRNRRMGERADAAILFWDGKSGGTADMAIRMLARHKPCEVIPWAPRRRAAGPARHGVGAARSEPHPDLAAMIAAGKSYIEIADRLEVSPRKAAKIVAAFMAKHRGA